MKPSREYIFHLFEASKSGSRNKNPLIHKLARTSLLVLVLLTVATTALFVKLFHNWTSIYIDIGLLIFGIVSLLYIFAILGEVDQTMGIEDQDDIHL